MKRILFLFTPLFLCFLIIFSVMSPAVALSEDISNKVFRIHILANSNSDEDQRLKLLIRDGIIAGTQELYSTCSSVEEAVEIANDNAELIKDIAEKTVKYNGYNYKVRVLTTKEYFNTREYDNFTLPAGIYNSLKIIIGEGKGHNWWCVMFPQVCLSGCTDDFDCYLTEEERELITSGGFNVKFKTVEIYEKIKSKLKGMAN